MNKKTVSVLKYVLGLGLGLVLLYFALRNVDFDEVKEGFQKANYLWVGLGLLVAILSHWFRAVRWKMLLKAAGYESNSVNLFAAIMVGYMVNQAVPRAGEISRATLGARTERIPIGVSFGTLITDRIFDVICLGLLLVGVVALQFDQIQVIIDNAFKSSGNAESGSGGGSTLLIVLGSGFVLGAILFFALRKRLEKISLFAKLYDFVDKMWAAIKSVGNMKQPLLFLFYTIGIWVCYIMMTYLVFFALEETANLPFIFALTAFTMGGIGMVFPAPGGIGSYHFAIILSFVAYATAFNWTETEANRIGTNIAFIIHTSQLIMMILVGFLCYLYLVPKVKVAEEVTEETGDSKVDLQPSKAN